jgi:predicted dehydrogenase
MIQNGLPPSRSPGDAPRQLGQVAVREGPVEKTDDDVRRLRRELSRLDPWSFWSVPSNERGADFSVVGTTGAFAIATTSLEGYVRPTSAGLRVGDRPVSGLWRLRRAARKVHDRLLASGLDARVETIVCLTRAFPAPATSVRGVRAVHVERLVDDIAQRPRVIDAKRAERLAQKLRSAGRR